MKRSSTCLTILAATVILATLGSRLAAEVGAVIHADEEFAKNTSVVWTLTFQSAWDAMNREMGGKPKVSGNELMEKLDGLVWDADATMPVGHWKAWAGQATELFVKKVNREASALTGDPEGPFEIKAGLPGSVAFYGLLDREVSFEREFHRSTRSGMVFHRSDGSIKNVSFWGVKGTLSSGFSRSVKVLDHDKDLSTHALQLETEGGKESVVLYLPKDRPRFSEACVRLRKWRTDWENDIKASRSLKDPWMHELDQIRVPYLELESETDVKGRLKGTRKYEGSDVPWRVAEAKQRVEFRLHEKGARVRAEVAGNIEPFGEAPKPPTVIPRDFTYDRPFFVFLWRDGAEWPYFGTWIGDAEGMTAFGT